MLIFKNKILIITCCKMIQFLHYEHCCLNQFNQEQFCLINVHSNISCPKFLSHSMKYFLCFITYNNSMKFSKIDRCCVVQKCYLIWIIYEIFIHFVKCCSEKRMCLRQNTTRCVLLWTWVVRSWSHSQRKKIMH